MNKAFGLIISIFLVFSVQHTALAQNSTDSHKDDCIKVGGSTGFGGLVAYTITSEACPADQHTILSTLTMRSVEEKKVRGTYIYTYFFENTGTYKIKLTFADYRLLGSPLTQILQDFSITLESGESRTIKFVAIGIPKQIIPFTPFAMWDNENSIWVFINSGNSMPILMASTSIFEEIQ